MRLALILIAVLVAESAFVVFLKTLGQPINWFSNVRLGAFVFGVQAVIIAVAGCFGPRKGMAIALGLTGAVLAALVWALALPIVSAFGVVMIVPIR